MKKTVLVFCFFWIFLGLAASLSGTSQESKNNMDSIIKVLKGNKIDFYVFSNDQGGKFLVVPKYGARILAAEVGGDNLFWVHPDALTGQGGQRSWISPEGGAKGFIFKPDWQGNRDFFMMDPGKYRIVHQESGQKIELVNRFQNHSNDEKEHYDLSLTRKIGLLEDPLKKDQDFTGAEYFFLGIDFEHCLKNFSSDTLDRILALWNLIQIPPGGTMVVPVKEVTSNAWRANYFEPIPKEYVRNNPDSISFFIDGSRRYKVGIRPESASGVIAYINKISEGDFMLVFMTFPVKPDFPYTDRPKTEQNTNGDAIQLYSHLEKGPLAFGELECQSWGLDLKPGSEESFPVKIYLYRGDISILKKIGKRLVCAGFDKAYLY
ncbi:MAG: hypothetical protein JXB26_06315 [Candidatus Aminicenantes bacterium]|nr:hypothetical protein [Candidatus Aminicenantes bacterium]